MKTTEPKRMTPHELNIEIWKAHGYECVASLPEHARYETFSIYTPENIQLIFERFTPALAWADAAAYLPDYAGNLHLAWGLYRQYIEAGEKPLPIMNDAAQMAYEICLAFTESFLFDWEIR